MAPKKLLITSLYHQESSQTQRPRFGAVGYKGQTEKIYNIWQGLGIRFVRSPLTSYQRGTFTKGWEFRGGKWQQLAPYRPQIVWNRMLFQPARMALLEELSRQHFLIGRPMFLSIANSKFLTSQIFRSVSPQTFFVASPADLFRAARRIPTSFVVVKPDTGSGGRGVMVLPKSKLTPSLITEPSIVQAFVETAKGFGNIAHSRFDLRVEMTNEKIFKAYIRMAPEKKFLSNVHQGGTMQWIPEKGIPASVKKILNSMQSVLSSFYPIYYTADFLIDAKGRPFLGEINHAPGIKFPDGFQGSEEDSWKSLARFFVDQYNQWKK